MNAQVGRKRERTESAGNDGCEIELWGFRGRDEDVRVARLGCDEGEDVAHSAAKLFDSFTREKRGDARISILPPKALQLPILLHSAEARVVRVERVVSGSA